MKKEGKESRINRIKNLKKKENINQFKDTKYSIPLQYMDTDYDIKTMELLFDLQAPNEVVSPITVENIHQH